MRAIIKTMHGLGDCLYLRGVIRSFLFERRMMDPGSEIFIRTPWPQFFDDLYIAGFLPFKSPLRTQAANERRHASLYRVTNYAEKDFYFGYSVPDFRRGLNVFESLRRCTANWISPLAAVDEIELPVKPAWYQAAAEVHRNRKIALVRLPTLRVEWFAPARNPKQEYMQLAVDWLKSSGFTTIGFADIAPGKEWLVEPHLKGIDEVHFGLPIELITALVATYPFVAPPGFPLPLALATGARALIIFGGHIAPEILMPRGGRNGIACVAPEPFCACVERECKCCNKEIPPEKIIRSLEGICDARI